VANIVTLVADFLRSQLFFEILIHHHAKRLSGSLSALG
jgi:hypothetical protein